MAGLWKPGLPGVDRACRQHPCMFDRYTCCCIGRWRQRHSIDVGEKMYPALMDLKQKTLHFGVGASDAAIYTNFWRFMCSHWHMVGFEACYTTFRPL